jgi:flagellar basal body P-ring formation protein FlgA
MIQKLTTAPLAQRATSSPTGRLVEPVLPAGRRSLASKLLLISFLVGMTGGFAQPVVGDESSSLTFALQPAIQVDSQGVFLHQVLTLSAEAALPVVRLADAPAFGQSLTLNRSQIIAVVRESAPELVATNWSGPDRVRVSRRARKFGEAELVEVLTSVLQRERIKDRGQLELRMSRTWNPLNVPDEPLNLQVLELPANGLAPYFVVRFELRTAQELLGTWQAPLQARLWREVWVARTPLKRGALLTDADVVRERRDVLLIHEPLADLQMDEISLETMESLPAGALVTERAVRQRPAVRRGQTIEASVQDGALAITMKVEILEDGLPGQTIRLRNPQSRRELRGKVLNEHLIQVIL